MKILIDGDSCPVVKITEQIAKDYNIPVMIFCDVNHEIQSDYAHVYHVGTGPDATDFTLVNRCRKGDIVITQDYGVAAMSMAMGAIPIHSSGFVYDDETLCKLLTRRHMYKKLKEQGVHVKKKKLFLKTNFPQILRDTIENILLEKSLA